MVHHDYQNVRPVLSVFILAIFDHGRDHRMLHEVSCFHNLHGQ